eukprot:TRINITY_DN57065_c0_g1_i1.p1 TRINITY_DN57065_c0_g1~~TRINITY_DN57065_c0_g1_i1.p1  ORF type:complete len:444 (+),score=50.14 TRINITY_DN57065_c0_g1_i1:31-1332(+)
MAPLPSKRDVLSVDVGCARKNADALTLAAAQCKWEVCMDGDAFVVWVLGKDDLISRLHTLQDGQLLSHIPGMHEACRKATLNTALRTKESVYWPKTWSFPESSAGKISKATFSAGLRTLIVKPDGGSQGDGIALACSDKCLRRILSELRSQVAIVQEYIDRPLLLDGFKWDARLYVLIIASEAGSLESYLAQDGLVRVCADSYEEPRLSNLNRFTAHLTNYSLNKNCDNFALNASADNAFSGSKRSLSAVLARLHAEGALTADPEHVWRELGMLVRETVDAMSLTLRAAAFDLNTWGNNEAALDDVRKRFASCFHIVGVDVMFDATGKPWLLEVNCNPSFNVDELRPVDATRVRTPNRALLFAGIRQDGTPLRSKWGSPCQCADYPRAHTHRLSAVDAAIKVPVLQGAFDVLTSAFLREQKSDITRGTIFQPV